MPHMTGTGILAMFALCLVGITVYSFLIFLPCWIIAKRRNVAGSWWNWVIPLWNSYIAFRLGNGSMKQATVAALLLVAGVIGVVLKDVSGIFMVAGGVLLGSAVVMFFYISYNWLMQIGILAGVHKPFIADGFACAASYSCGGAGCIFNPRLRNNGVRRCYR